MKRVRRAWDLNDLTVRFVRHMLASNDEASLLETGSGTSAEAALMVRCYELAAMDLWDEHALLEVATVAGDEAGFTIAGEAPERLQRKLALAIKSNSAPEFMSPPNGVRLLYRLGVLVYDELEETISHLEKIGRYSGDDPGNGPLNEPSVQEPLGVIDAMRQKAPPAPVSIRIHKLRKNLLDVPIEKAVKEAGTLDTAAVYIKLKELALNGEQPFTGVIEKKGLCYTDDDNKPATLTKKALGQRLGRQKQ
jgi:hypothetical protein